MNRVLDEFLTLFYQNFERIAGRPDISDLVSKFFKKVGTLSKDLYSIQDQVLALGRMLLAWYKQEYTNISPTTLFTLLAALVYFVNPLDIIPDFIPLIGKVDDILIISLVIKRLNKEIERFMAWEKETKV